MAKGKGERKADSSTVMNLQMPPERQEAFRQFCERRMYKQRDVMSRLLRWFLDQPGAAQSAILGTVDEGMERAYAQVLRTLATAIESHRMPELQAAMKSGLRDPKAPREE